LGRFVQGIAGAVFLILFSGICVGCGGGATAVIQQPQDADFSVAVSSSAVTISQGGVSAPVNFSIIPHNGFSGNVQVTFAGLPAGISSNPASPFAIACGIDTAVDFGAAATASTGTAFAVQTVASREIRDSSLYVTGVPTEAELNQVPGRVAVPGLAMHPTGALIYQPFLTGAARAPNVRGGIDISDARSGQLRMRIFLPQQFMTDVDALHGDFLTIDENGQRLFAITSLDGSPQNAALTVAQLASVPLAIGSLSSPTTSVAGETPLMIRGSGFQAGIKLTIGGKTATATLVDMNTLTAVSPAVAAGPQQLTLTNANGETVSLDAAVTAN